jgi:hypothetical protein
MRLIVLCICLIGLVACAAPAQDGGTQKKRRGMYLSMTNWSSESQDFSFLIAPKYIYWK